jgi:uncharacterized membrane protein
MAIFFFAGSWKGYTYYSDRMGKDNLLAATNRYRLQWMQQMVRRDNRTVDAITVGNLLRSITFFASTTIFILLGLMTMLGYREKLTDILGAVPFAEQAPEFLWEIKILLLIMIFIYAFFKYTWSLRQYNYTNIYIVAMPDYRECVDEYSILSQRGAALVGNAARHFNNGLRAYYFGLAALGWFVHPVLFMAATSWVVFVTHRREFRSATLNTLAK